jgi:hypothetical protein
MAYGNSGGAAVTDMRVFIFGAGYSGKAFARANPIGAAITGTTRSPEKLPALEAAGIRPFVFDGGALSEEIAEALAETTHLVISIAPDGGEKAPSPSRPLGSPPLPHSVGARNGAKLEGRHRSSDSSPPRSGGEVASPKGETVRGFSGNSPIIGADPIPADNIDPVIAAARDTIINDMPRLRWIGYLSTVGVYGDHQGAWIDETAECAPKSARSQRRVEAEREWLDLEKQRGLPVAILRLSGIYGPGRNALVNLRDGTAKRLVKKDQVFNRIHVDDIAGALWHLAERDRGGIFNVTDDLPAPPQDVVTYAAALMDVEPPPEMPFETAELSPMARSFYGENKRVSNAAIRATGCDFRYPTYRAAFDAMWAEGNWADGEPRGPIRRT